jgi:hypothetical protein
MEQMAGILANIDVQETFWNLCRGRSETCPPKLKVYSQRLTAKDLILFS